jgi:hypothetical protein
LPVMLMLAELAVGLEPSNVPGAAGAVGPDPFPEFWVPRWPEPRAIKQTKNCRILLRHPSSVKRSTPFHDKYLLKT